MDDCSTYVKSLELSLTHNDVVLDFYAITYTPLMAHKSVIVGSVVERKPTSSFSTPKPAISCKTGFPIVQHRSKSAFARNRDDLRRSVSRPKDVPIVLPTNIHSASTEPVDWRRQISKENEERVERMTKC